MNDKLDTIVTSGLSGLARAKALEEHYALFLEDKFGVPKEKTLKELQTESDKHYKELRHKIIQA